MHITITKGLDIPIKGKPTGALRELAHPESIAANFSFSAFDDVRFLLHVHEGDHVQIGQPLVEDRQVAKRMFISPAAGRVKEIRRGEKRRLQAIVIECDEQESYFPHRPLDIATIPRDVLIDELLARGAFIYMRARPFYRVATPAKLPRTIFVKALETAPFLPPAEMQVEGREELFHAGLQVLSRLTDGPVHLVHHKNSTFKGFTEAPFVERHTIEGPHPAGNLSVHIHHIDPIRSAQDMVWTLNVLGVITMGSLALTGKPDFRRVVSIAGEGVKESERGFYRARFGYPVKQIFEGRLQDIPSDYISGDLLTGDLVSTQDHLGFIHTMCAAIPKPQEREALHFVGLGKDKFTASRTYLSHFLNGFKRLFSFTTSMHGDERAFMDGRIYEQFMPMNILPMQLVRACQAENYDLAELYGLLEVVPEDFALAEFACPSKIPLMDIIRTGLKKSCKDILG